MFGLRFMPLFYKRKALRLQQVIKRVVQHVLTCHRLQFHRLSGGDVADRPVLLVKIVTPLDPKVRLFSLLRKSGISMGYKWM